MPDDRIILSLLYGGCAVLYAALSLLILAQARRSFAAWRMAAATATTALWAAVCGMVVPFGMLATALDLVRALAWLAFVLHLYGLTVQTRAELPRLFRTMAMVVALAAAVALLHDHGAGAVISLAVAGRIGVAACMLLLLENLYLNAPSDARWHLALPCLALAGLSVYDIALCTSAVLSGGVSLGFLGGRAAAVAMVAPLLALAAARNRCWRIDVHVSRAAAFHSATLVLSGIFLLSLVTAGTVIQRAGNGWGAVAANALIFGGALALTVFLTSASVRSRLRRLLVAHFFNARYDYRQEWLRCTATLAGADSYVPLHVRAVRAIADVVDCPAGILFLRDQDEAGSRADFQADFHWAGSWNMPSVAQPVPSGHALPAALAHGIWMADEAGAAPAPLHELPRLWLAVPLNMGDRLTGFVLLARPRAPFRLDEEVTDLLRIVARVVAAHVAERRATQVLIQTRQLHDYGKRFAFVAHDIKNVSSQLSLLLSNAEMHIGNPEFQRDMLATVQASVQKIGALLKRLQTREDRAEAPVLAPLDRLAAVVETARRLRGAAVVLEQDGGTASLTMSAGAFDAVLSHVLNNAIDASPQGAPVRVALRHEKRRVVIDITDSGPGMTPEFIRDELFRPFGTSKREGTGIGAFQARELAREAGGDLLVFSRPGAGTTIRLLLVAEAEAAPAAA